MYEQVAKNIFGSEKNALLSAIEHEFEVVELGILKYSAKYGASFDEFSRYIKNGKVPADSYEVEMDFMEWETLEARKKKLADALRRLY